MKVEQWQPENKKKENGGKRKQSEVLLHFMFLLSLCHA